MVGSSASRGAPRWCWASWFVTEGESGLADKLVAWVAWKAVCQRGPFVLREDWAVGTV